MMEATPAKVTGAAHIATPSPNAVHPLLVPVVATFVALPTLPLSLLAETSRSPVRLAFVTGVCATVAAVTAARTPKLGLGRVSIGWSRRIASVSRAAGSVCSLLMIGTLSYMVFGQFGAAMAVCVLAVGARYFARDVARVLCRAQATPNADGFPEVDPVRRLLARSMLLGTIMLLAALISQSRTRLDFGGPHAPPPTTEFIVAFAGFVAATLVLVAHARHTAVRARWARGDVVAAAHIAQRWLRLDVLLVSVALLVCAVGVVVILTGLFSPLASAIVLAWDTSVSYVAGVLERLGFFFLPQSIHHRHGHLNQVPLGPRRKQGRPGHGGTINVWLLLLDLAIVLSIAGAIARVYRRWLMARYVAVVAWLRSLFERFVRRRVRYVLARLAIALDRNGAGATPLHRLFSRGMTPRQQVIYRYHQLLWRAAASGIERETGATAHEFGRRLSPLTPGAESHLDTMTDAFVEARYSRHPIDEPHARLVDISLRIVTIALRRLRSHERVP